MAQRKTERLMNLVFTLLATNQYLTKDQIRSSIAEYREDTDVAFERKFERDKQELRDLGLEIETGTYDALGGVPGYRLLRADVELPQIDLTVEEAAVIGLAGQLWDHAGMAAETTTALAKLKAIGNDFDPSVLRMTEARLSAEEPSFDAVFDATGRRMPIAFEYRRPDGETTVRHLEPWGMTSFRERWYVGGFDRDRRRPRLFRLSRIVGDVKPDGEPGEYEVPADADLKKVARALHPPEPTASAVLRVTAGRGQSLRRYAVRIDPVDGTTDEVEIAYAALDDLAAEVASYGPDVVVVSPPELRDAVIDRLRSIAEAHA
ncbi:WYL domain-containing protein [Aeromicrobium sp. 636]|uniref:WYL domain-containing protein n=1 Tax=Aeromicrobium senzhongii TaxID=2663859 RepID=A0A8I0ESW1_9ACTN|nr:MULTISPECIES: WYL domain-containing protein [Aeromicrobium]MBC9225018.1 WYL domain-containing protein [Aeromicrobium senzhongii]MCQ3997129.1 WYL domain-containing protein [Aeromicrobium sp. 636]MTB87070.1 WYL domain-containing protein [Aeromicrobium senzhongii]QNL93113.1 WYL domain-containing protein [Aeromicrobium senzhongii]